MPKCELCELLDYTQRYADFVHPFKFTILDCDSCDTPMAVLGDHRAVPTDQEREFMIEALSLVARAKYGADKFGIDDVMRHIPDQFAAGNISCCTARFSIAKHITARFREFYLFGMRRILCYMRAVTRVTWGSASPPGAGPEGGRSGWFPSGGTGENG